jgi:hypothetical protein
MTCGELCWLHPQRGVAYLLLMLALAMLGMTATVTVQVGQSFSRSDAEMALLDSGAQFVKALQSYANLTPPGQPRAPKELHELLRDPRYPGVVRHLRSVASDPQTGAKDWGLVRDQQGFILGVYSQSMESPMKIADFDGVLSYLNGRQVMAYQDWIFGEQGVVFLDQFGGAHKSDGQMPY